MTLREKQSKFDIKMSKVLLFANDQGTPMVVTEWKRSRERQRMLVARGFSKTMKSLHIDGLAKDAYFVNDILDDGKINYDNEKYRVVGEYAESIGLKWGGRFGDDPDTHKIEGWDCGHFEYDYQPIPSGHPTI